MKFPSLFKFTIIAVRNTMLVPLVCLGLCLTSASVLADDAEDQAVATIKKICTSAACLGGECGLVARDEKAAGKPMIEVNLSIATGWKGTAKTDAALAEVKKLKNLPSGRSRQRRDSVRERVRESQLADVGRQDDRKKRQAIRFRSRRVSPFCVANLAIQPPSIRIE